MSKRLKHAFTLVELVVVTMLLGVIMTSIVMIIRPTQKHYNNITNKAQEQNKCIPVSDIIDAELRYSTALKIIYTDKNGNTASNGSVWDNVDAADYPNFFHLSNNHREMIGAFNARGYAEKGQTQTGNTVYSMINKGYFTDFDYQFSIPGINTAAGQQSLTLKIDAAPMLVTADSVTLDEDRTHSFEETFKLMNLRNKSSLGGRVLDMSIPSDSLEDYVNAGSDEFGDIYIFYALPRDVASSGGTTSTPVHGTGFDFGGAYDSAVPNLHINDVNEVDHAVIHLVAGSEYTGAYKITAYNPDGSQKSGQIFSLSPDWNLAGNGQNLSGNRDIRVNCADETGYITINATDRSNQEIGRIDLSAFAVTPEIWVYDMQIYYTDPSAVPENAHTTVIHYLYSIGETYRGLCFSNATADPHTIRVNGDIPGVVACDGDRDIQVLVYDADSHVDVSPGYSPATTSSGSFVVDYNSPAEIWVFNGVFYERASDVPERVAPITFHYLTDIFDMGHGFGLSSDPANNAISNGTLIGDMPTYFRGDGNFDIVVNLNRDVTLSVYDATGGFFNYVAWNAVQREYWIYNSALYTSMPEVASYDYDIQIHYIKSNADDDLGLRVYDIDTYAQSSQINGTWIPDRSSINADFYDNSPFTNISAQSTDFTITLKHFDARVKIMGVGRYGANSLNCQLASASPNELWIYQYNVYESYEAVAPLLPENQPEPEPPVPGTLEITGYNIINSWGSGGQVNVQVQAPGGDTYETRVAITMANPINSGNGWGSWPLWGSVESISGNTIIVKLNGIPAGSTGDFTLQIDSQDFAVVSVEVI